MFAKNTNFDLKIPTLKIGELINKINVNTNKKNKSFLISDLKFQKLIIEEKKKIKK